MDPREAMPQLAHLAYEMCARGVPRLDEPAILANLRAMREELTGGLVGSCRRSVVVDGADDEENET
jgi:hypothetical protein